MKATLNVYRQSSPNLVDNLAQRNQSRMAGLVQSSQRFLKHIIRFFINTSEPHIWEYRDRSGQVIWQVYDPVTGLSASFASETAVRVWLEQRYSQ